MIFSSSMLACRGKGGGDTRVGDTTTIRRNIGVVKSLRKRPKRLLYPLYVLGKEKDLPIGTPYLSITCI